jgi:predicted AAA+ superfamily ATPase
VLIPRTIAADLQAKLGGRRAIVLMGARQVGKTTLLQSLLQGQEGVLWLNADEARVRAMFDDLSAVGFAPYLAGYSTLVLDEAQRIEDIGLKLKILQDAFGEKVQIIATGSSSFELANQVNEPLTGRKWEFTLFPLTIAELVAHNGLLAEEQALESRLRYGCYPEVVAHPDDAREILVELANDNLYKDVFRLRQIRKAAEFERLVQALAYQVGSQISVSELGATAGLDKKTAEAYIRLLEQAYVVFRIGSYARNLRNELTSSSKVFFYDVGIRNAVIGDFSAPSARSDIGGLFENFVIAELVKRGHGKPGWFWRTTAGQEVDYLTETVAGLDSFEIKWNPAKSRPLPKTFTQAYEIASATTIHRDNAVKFLAAVPAT